MLSFLKKISVFKVFSKKRFILLLALITLVLLTAPLKPVLASWWDFLNPTTWISGIIAVVLKLILLIAKSFLRIANWLLGVAIGNPWGVSYTIPGAAPPANPIIDVGWTLLRDITNMLFILGLAYIGLATALNLTKFETKKTFFNLILIAILINFTPVICGVVVDMTNIVANFFLQGIDFKVLLDVFDRQQADLSKHWTDLIANGAIMMKALFLIAYGFIGAFVVLLYAALFLVRAPIIWVLVIFSPLAFFAWIFSQTKKYFNQWWSIFLQWTTIVIPSAFFLYLSQQVLVKSKDLISFPADDFMGKFMGNIAPYGVALFFMIVGLIMSTKINAMGAGALRGAAKKGLKEARTTAGGLAKRGGKGIRNYWKSHREAQLKPGEEGYDKWAQEHKASAGMRKAGRYMFGGETDEERAKWEKPGLARAGRVGARAFTSLYTFGAPVWARRATRKVAAQAEESTKNDLVKAQEKYDGKTIATKKTAIKNAAPGFLGRIKRMAALKAAIKDGDPLEHLGLEDWETKRIMQDATKLDPSSMFTIRNVNPFLAAEVANELKMTDAVKKQAGIHIKDEDKEKYKQTVTEDDERVKVMTEEEKKEALLVDEEGKPIEINGKKQYKVKYTQTVTEDDLAIKAMTEQDREKRLLKNKDGTAKLDKDDKKQYKKDIDPLSAKLIAEIRTDQMKTWNEDLAKQIATSDIAHDLWNSAHVGKAAELFATKFLSAFREKMQQNGAGYYEEKNPLLAKYFTSTPARTLGLDFGEAADVSKIERIKKQIASKRDLLTKVISEPERTKAEEDIENLEKQLRTLEATALRVTISKAGVQARVEREMAKKEKKAETKFIPLTDMAKTPGKTKEKKEGESVPLTDAAERGEKPVKKKEKKSPKIKLRKKKKEDYESLT